MIYFQETQKMKQWWLWAIVLLASGFVLWGIGQKVSASPEPLAEFLQNPELWFSILVLILVLVLLFLLTLKTEVGPTGVRIRYFPLWSTHIAWNEVQNAKIIQYGFVGYGIRFTFRYGTVYNAQGNQGLQIVKKNGSKILIGTQRPGDLKAAVKRFL